MGPCSTGPSIPTPLDAGTPAGEAWRMEVVLFVPGFFGFGSFGHPDRPLIEYFARVEDALLRAHGPPTRFAGRRGCTWSGAPRAGWTRAFWRIRATPGCRSART